MDRTKILISLTLIICGIFFSQQSSASSSICGDDQAGINAAHGQGMVVVNRFRDLIRCRKSSLLLRFDVPSSSRRTRMCFPSTPANVPAGFVIDSYSPCSSASSTGTVGGYTLRRPSASSSSVIRVCSNSPVPSGYVVSRTGFDGNCSSSISNVRDAMNITLPSSTPGSVTTRCTSPNTALPAGFVITSYSLTSSCRGGSGINGGASTITIPSPTRQTFVCSGSPVPVGFAYSSQSSSSRCSASQFGSGTGYTIGPVTGNSTDICASNSSHVPNGYVVTNQSANSLCGSFSRWRVARPSNSGTTAACNVGGRPIIPSGYILSRINRTSACTGGGINGYSIRIASGRSESICQGPFTTPTVPAGWAVSSVGTSSNCAGGRSATIIPINGDGPYLICSSSPPEGYVITRLTLSWTCGNLSSSPAWVVARPSQVPGDTTTHCGLLEHIPEGFVVTSTTPSTRCNRSFGTGAAFTITQPSISGNTSVCPISPVPSGFATISSSFTGRCGSLVSLLISPLTGSGPFQVCDFAGIPDSYVVTQVLSGDLCGSHGGIVIREPNVQGSTLLCRFVPDSFATAETPIPSGYAVVGITSSRAQCPLGVGLSITFPNVNSATNVCGNFPIPDGYVRATYGGGSYARCDGANGFPIVPLLSANSNAAVVPSPFILQEEDIVSPPQAPSVQCSTSGLNGGLIGQAESNPVGCH